MSLADDVRRVRKEAMVGLVGAGAAGIDVSSHIASASARVMVDECMACPLGEKTPNRVPYEGGPGSIIFIGEAPGAREADEGRPFVGPSGKLLRAQIKEAGITEFAVGNTIACRPPVNSYDTAIEVGAPDACRPHLDRAIETSGAWIVISVGGKAAAQFGWHGSVSSAIGKWRWRANRLHTTIWHPSYLLRRGAKHPTDSHEGRHVVEVLTEAYRASQGVGYYTPPASYTSQTAKTIGTSTTVDMVRATLMKVGYVAIYSKVLDRNVVVYDRNKITPMSSIDLPSGFGNPLYFTVEELVRLKRPIDVCRVAAIKNVINVEVVG